MGEDRVAFIGHGIGVELDELPVLAKDVPSLIEDGQVVAIEPKVVLPRVGMIGVEDTHFVTEGGAEVITLAKYDTLG
jgi:Xaa-Pro aminopeptidase